MRDAIAILASCSVTLPATHAPAPPSHHRRRRCRPSPRTNQSLNSTAPSLHSTVRWDYASTSRNRNRNRKRLEYYTDLTFNLARDGRFRDLFMIAESFVVSGGKPSQFVALLDVNIVSAGISRMIKDGRLGSLIEVLGGLRKLGFAVVELFDGLAVEALRQECRRQLGKRDDVEEIVSLLEILQGLGFSTKEFVAPSEIIRLCVYRRTPSAAIRYAQIFPQVHTLLCTIMIEFGKKRDLVSALCVFEVSKQNQGCPNMYAYRTIIDVCGLCGDYLKSRSIYEELLDCKFIPNIYVFNSLMNVNASDFSYMLHIYKQMQKVGVTADLASYNILLKSCCLAARAHLALDIYRDVQHLESKGALKLDVFTYCTMIKVLADARMWRMALEIKEHMLLAGVIPNTVTWSSLISACANAGLAEQAIQLFEEMLQAGCEPNSQCCNALLHACVEAHQYDRAFRLFKSWKENGIKMSVRKDFHWMNKINDYACSKHENSSTITCRTSDSEHPSFPIRFSFAPTTSTYNILMKACGTDYYHAKALMDEMKMEGLSPNNITWSILIDICGGSGNVHGALQILRSMHQAGTQPDVVTYTTAIKICVEHKNIKVAFSLLAEMKRYQIKPNLVTYNTLLRARSQYGSLQEVQQCLAIYQDMRKAGYKPNDFYLKLLIEEWCEGVIQQNKQNKGQIASDRASLGPQSLLLEKVAEHLQDSNAESLSIDIRGLTKIEARIMVLAVLRMIKEKYNPGDSVRDDLLIILEEEPWGCASRHETGSTEAIANLLQYDLGLEVLSVGSVDGRNFNGGFDTSFLCPNSKVLQRRDLPLKLESRSRRPVPLQRLKVTKGSLHHWLQKGGASTSRSD
ncbi:unnamed protein product [Coffea canephora]|uniref:Pentacotripeptide-repeat region of PRORP domain-containing protein n=1 Tax=Coffea canephora TaxID=49390 RepID=A0A068UE18_COFCA|nr:unnamed protein product [Coffea canephora]